MDHNRFVAQGMGKRQRLPPAQGRLILELAKKGLRPVPRLGALTVRGLLRTDAGLLQKTGGPVA